MHDLRVDDDRQVRVEIARPKFPDAEVEAKLESAFRLFNRDAWGDDWSDFISPLYRFSRSDVAAFKGPAWNQARKRFERDVPYMLKDLEGHGKSKSELALKCRTWITMNEHHEMSTGEIENDHATGEPEWQVDRRLHPVIHELRLAIRNAEVYLEVRETEPTLALFPVGTVHDLRNGIQRLSTWNPDSYLVKKARILLTMLDLIQ